MNRYLVYRLINGRISSEIQHGQYQTGEGVKIDPTELERYELLDHNEYPLSTWEKLYPYKGTVK